MKLARVRDGVLEVRWTWLPLWIATNPKLKDSLEHEMRDRVALNGLTDSEEDMEALHDFLVGRIQGLFPTHPGLGEFLDGLKYVREPDSGA